MSRINLKDVRKSFAGKVAIDSLSLDIEEGEFFVLLGPSGCGKTTTLRCVAGLEEPDSGCITIEDRIVAQPENATFIPPNKRQLGMVFQSYGLWPHMSVYNNIGYPLRARHLPRRDFDVAINEALALVDLTGYERRYPNELSGGQQQRVALARAMVTKPSLLLFDEPLSNLDAQLRARLRIDLRRIHRERKYTAVYVTHDQSEALALADRVAVMRNGRIEQLGAPRGIFRSPNSRFVAEFVGYENFIPATVALQSGLYAVVKADGWDQVLRGRITTNVTPGEKVWAAVRSTNVEVSEATTGTDDINSLSATLSDLIYVGDHYQCVVRSGPAMLLGVLSLAAWSEQYGVAQASGRAINLSIPADDLIILSRSNTSVA